MRSLGADTHALEKLNDTFILQHLPLNICYRCPENVIRLARNIVPTIEWNTSRQDKGDVKFITMKEAILMLKPDDVIVGRKNRDLVKIYRKFVLDLKKPIKFRNAELVSSLVNNLEQVMMEYLKLYARGINIFKPLTEHMTEFVKSTGYTSGTDLYDKEYADYSKQLVDDNTGKSTRQVMRSNYTVTYLEQCMQDYKDNGEYGLSVNDPLTEFYDVIQDFIKDFRKASAKIRLDDFKAYIKAFLSGSKYERVPMLGSVHSMKGGEADNIFIYNYPLFPYRLGGNSSEDDEQQERNLQYVAITRAKKNLYLIKCDEADEKGMKANLECEALVDMLLNKTY